MPNEISIRIAGEAGQGMQTIGNALCQIFKKAGCYIYANQDYMSRVRGGNNFFQLRISDVPVYTLRQKADIVVALNKESVSLHRKDVAPGGILILDKEKFGGAEEGDGFFDLPFYGLAKAYGSEIFMNTVCCGAILGLTGVKLGYLEEAVKDAFADKGEEIVQKNVAAAKSGYEHILKNFKGDKFRVKAGKATSEGLLMDGNAAIALGAIKGGCKFYCAYPMTPSTSIMDNVSHFASSFNIFVEQAEDEIAAINMVIGASFAGVRAMTATSGGGFCLMVEGLSLAGMTETPIVAVDAQRPAPATGFPTRTEQSDLNFLIHAGHGEFARVVFSPGTPEEAYSLTVKAFNLAEKYQVPVLIMTDQHLADSLRNIEGFKPDQVRVERHIISKKDSAGVKDYKRYQLTESGISPRVIPSWVNDPVYLDSDEHNEEGHITEDGEMRVKMVEKRLYKKMAGLKEEIERPVTSNVDQAGTVIIGFGSTYGVIKEACEALGKNFGCIHLPQVWPFPANELTLSLKAKKNIVTVENNAGAQLAMLLTRETGIKVKCSILRYDGRPFDLDYLIERIKEISLNEHK